MPLELLSFLSVEATRSTASNSGLPGWSQGVIGAVVTLSVAYLTYLGVKRKARAEENSTSVQSQSEALKTLIKGLTDRVDKLEEQVGSLSAHNEELRRENLKLHLEVRHKDDLIGAYTRWITAHEEYVQKGMPDPPGPPPYSWQMLMHLREASEITREPP